MKFNVLIGSALPIFRATNLTHVPCGLCAVRVNKYDHNNGVYANAHETSPTPRNGGVYTTNWRRTKHVNQA